MDQQSQTYQEYDYKDDFISGYETTRKPFNLLEIGLALLLLLMIVGVGLWGYFSQNSKNRDRQREHDIVQIVSALDNFYSNSSPNSDDRFYPIAVCSEQLNEIDFEFTLRQFLTGNRPEIDPHTYINPQEYPRDNWGIYSSTIANREINLRTCPKVQYQLTSTNQPIYTNGAESCNFDKSAKKYRNCYLYSSSISGDRYEVGYYSEVKNSFIVYSRFRSRGLEIVEIPAVG